MIELLFIQVTISVILNNEIYGPYGDLLQKAIEKGQEGLAEFWVLTFQWLKLILIYSLIGAITNIVARLYAFYWRKAMTFSYIPRVKQVPKIEGESQRIQEDPGIYADILESLGLQAVRTIMVLIAFMPILWTLSKKANLKVNLEVIRDVISYSSLLLPVSLGISAILLSGLLVHRLRKRPFPRFLKLSLLSSVTITTSLISIVMLEPLVWLAILTSIGGTGISWLVGIKLPGLEYNNQKVEASFRKELVLGEDDRINSASPETLYELFKDIEHNYKRLFLHYCYFDLWSHWYDLVLAFLPAILIAPSLFTGLITLGVLTQIENVFFKVQSGFSFIMNNWVRITKLRSVWKRLHEFEANLDKYQPQN